MSMKDKRAVESAAREFDIDVDVLTVWLHSDCGQCAPCRHVQWRKKCVRRCEVIRALDSHGFTSSLRKNSKLIGSSDDSDDMSLWIDSPEVTSLTPKTEKSPTPTSSNTNTNTNTPGTASDVATATTSSSSSPLNNNASVKPERKRKSITDAVNGNVSKPKAGSETPPLTSKGNSNSNSNGNSRAALRRQNSGSNSSLKTVSTATPVTKRRRIVVPLSSNLSTEELAALHLGISLSELQARLRTKCGVCTPCLNPHYHKSCLPRREAVMALRTVLDTEKSSPKKLPTVAELVRRNGGINIVNGGGGAGTGGSRSGTNSGNSSGGSNGGGRNDTSSRSVVPSDGGVRREKVKLGKLGQSAIADYNLSDPIYTKDVCTDEGTWRRYLNFRKSTITAAYQESLIVDDLSSESSIPMDSYQPSLDMTSRGVVEDILKELQETLVGTRMSEDTVKSFFSALEVIEVTPESIKTTIFSPFALPRLVELKASCNKSRFTMEYRLVDMENRASSYLTENKDRWCSLVVREEEIGPSSGDDICDSDCGRLKIPIISTPSLNTTFVRRLRLHLGFGASARAKEIVPDYDLLRILYSASGMYSSHINFGSKRCDYDWEITDEGISTLRANGKWETVLSEEAIPTGARNFVIGRTFLDMQLRFTAAVKTIIDSIYEPVQCRSAKEKWGRSILTWRRKRRKRTFGLRPIEVFNLAKENRLPWNSTGGDLSSQCSGGVVMMFTNSMKPTPDAYFSEDSDDEL